MSVMSIIREGRDIRNVERYERRKVACTCKREHLHHAPYAARHCNGLTDAEYEAEANVLRAWYTRRYETPFEVPMLPYRPPHGGMTAR